MMSLNAKNKRKVKDNLDNISDITCSSDNDSNDSSGDSKIVDVKEIEFSTKEKYYYRTINSFFRKTDESNIKKMLDIINGNSVISLRLLDWFVTRYANKYKISYKLNTGNESNGNYKIESDKDFNVYVSYKAQLKSYKKRYFDPFRRRKKFFYHYDKKDDSKIIHTTIGQLNFFRWSFSNNIIGYVEKNYKKINESMIISNKKDKKKKEINKKKDVHKVKKQNVNISASALDSCSSSTDGKFKIVLSFD